MTDRELLEAAAKAAGMRPFKAWGMAFVDGAGLPPKAEWNPLVDDGDALRLMVAQKISVNPGHSKLTVCAKARLGRVWSHEMAGDDLGAATRRAITRAAAAMAKG